MSAYVDHIRGGVRAYGALLVLALGLWVARGWLPIEGAAYLVPVGSGVVRSVIGVGLCLLTAVVASLAPDVDIKSKAQLLFYRGFLVADVALIALYYTRQDLRYLEGAAFLGLLVILPLVGKHRGWTHSRIAMVLMPSPLLVVPVAVYGQRAWSGVPYYLAALLGYASHLHMDGMLFGRRARALARRPSADAVGRSKAAWTTLRSRHRRADAEALLETVREDRTHTHRSRKRA